ncbi:dirigent protein 20-like [Cucumis melo var. makuwa]|uniref:Dirigent protein n=2 Tax=Cucumis melo TaxID=3656 RepID=A0A5D3DDS9_CUCMM|nr:dirigent protein 20-like [Cucumis melo]TYK21675.1 dirigent protein 20-like [Cucumis melo var. makuwa]
MAGISPISATHFFFLSFLLSSVVALAIAEDEPSFARTVERKRLGLRKEKLSHFRLYWHDVLSGKYPTSIQIVPPVSNTSMTGFGLVNMIDNPLTETPDPKSKLWGRAQGLYASASQDKFGLLMAMNFAFVSGKYNGSSLTIFGRNPFMEKVREMPVIGGSGLFRFARGYAEASTKKVDFKTGDAVVEYNIYVLHY